MFATATKGERASAIQLDGPTIHSWEQALLCAHHQLTLKWLPLIGMQAKCIMDVLLTHLHNGTRAAVIPQSEIARLCSIHVTYVGRLLKRLEEEWNLIERVKRQGPSMYRVSSALLPDYGTDSPEPQRWVPSGPLFNRTIPISKHTLLTSQTETPVLVLASDRDPNMDQTESPVLIGLTSGCPSEIRTDAEREPDVGQIESPVSVSVADREPGVGPTAANKENARALAAAADPSSTRAAAADVMPIQKVLSSYEPTSLNVAQRIFEDCRQRAPDVTPEEVAELVGGQAAPAFRRLQAGKVHSVVAIVLHWSREGFTQRDLEMLRAARRQKAELKAEAKRQEDAEGLRQTEDLRAYEQLLADWEAISSGEREYWRRVAREKIEAHPAYYRMDRMTQEGRAKTIETLARHEWASRVMERDPVIHE